MSKIESCSTCAHFVPDEDNNRFGTCRPLKNGLAERLSGIQDPGVKRDAPSCVAFMRLPVVVDGLTLQVTTNTSAYLSADTLRGIPES